jgi:colanic acid biosynthesis glycosyl transferase WcaI
VAHILVLSLVFPPDGVSTAVILGELSADLKKAGHDVTVVTTVPHYNRDREAEARQQLTQVWGPLLYRSELEGMRVLHVAMPRKTGSVILRLLAWMQFHVLSLVVALALVRRIDVIVTASPPLTVGVCAWLLGAFYRAPYVYNVQELYPDIAIALGALRNRWAIRVLYALERFVYARAKFITVIAARMRRRILDKAVPPEKVRLIPNFVDVETMLPLPKVNDFSRAHGLDAKRVVTYAGNMGPAQGLDSVLDAAALLKDEPSLVFLLIGEGSEYSRLQASAIDRGLTNVIVMAHQPYALVPQIYAASDLCLVPLAPHAGSDAVPSKVYRIMACERAVLACAGDETDLAELVRLAQCGAVVAPGSAEALAAGIRGAIREPGACAAMGRAGRAHVLAHYSRSIVSAQYGALIHEAVNG